MLTARWWIIAVPRLPVTLCHSGLDYGRRPASIFNELSVVRVRHFVLVYIEGPHRNLMLAPLFLPSLIRTHSESAAFDQNHLARLVSGGDWRGGSNGGLFGFPLGINKREKHNQPDEHDSGDDWNDVSLSKKHSNHAVLADHQATR